MAEHAHELNAPHAPCQDLMGRAKLKKPRRFDGLNKLAKRCVIRKVTDHLQWANLVVLKAAGFPGDLELQKKPLGKEKMTDTWSAEQ